MSRLDLLSQTTPRLVDTQSRNASMTPDAQESNGNAATSDFGSFLEGFSGKAQKEGATTSQQETALLSAEADKANPDLDKDDTDPLQALLPEVSPSDGSTGATVLQSGGSAFSILENLLPRILARTSNGGGADAERSGASPASAYLSLPQQDMAEPNLLNSGVGSKLAVSVQNQETHFRPIVEGLGAAPTETGATTSNEETGSASVDPFVSKLKPIEANDRQPGKYDGSSQILTVTAAETALGEAREEQGNASKVSLERMSDRAELQKQSSVGGTRIEGASLPSSTLQHLAGSIIEDVKGISESQQPSIQYDGLNRVAMARASAGVLRVLDLQLKPAELGLVTIKIRLSGDSLEMEIQAESEDTAELLRNDAEKLSGLLRASGYRPDVINVQSTEATSHDRSSFQRSQQGSQSQGQSFEQGAAAGQGNSSRHRDDRYGSGGSEALKDAKEGQASGSSISRGIYL